MAQKWRNNPCLQGTRVAGGDRSPVSGMRGIQVCPSYVQGLWKVKHMHIKPIVMY